MTVEAIQQLCETDEVAASTLATFASRLQECDPAMLGTYAEHLVAAHTGGRVSDQGWGPVDLLVPCDGIEIEVQVKAARAFRTFKRGTVANVGFSTKPSRNLEEVWSQIDTPATRAQVWVFALHGGRTLKDGWRFFAVAGSELDELGQSSISLNMLVLRFGFPVAAGGLSAAVLNAHRRSGCPSDTAGVWACAKCEVSYAVPGSLRAHQARSGHRITADDFDDVLDDAYSSCTSPGSSG